MAIPCLAHPSRGAPPLDRLPWVDGVCFEAYGARVGVRVTQARVMPQILKLLPPGWKGLETREVEELISYQVGSDGPHPADRSPHLVHADSIPALRTDDAEAALHAVESCAQVSVALHAKGRVFIHAGVVGWRGKAILLPGRSFAGKSTLVAALLRAGATNYSDEYAVLDEAGRVHPYLRRISLRDGAGVFRQRLTAEDLGSRSGDEPLPVGLVALTHYRAGARWFPKPLSPSKAALALFDNAVAARRIPEQCLHAIHQATSLTLCIQATRGEAAETVDQLLASCSW